MNGHENISKKQLLRVIDDLRRQPGDKVRILGDIGITTVGLGLGAAAAGTLATFAGATAIPFVTATAAFVGVTAVAITPIGWIIGTAAAGGALAYGVSRLIRDGGISEGRKKELLQIYMDRLHVIQCKEKAEQISPNDRNQFIFSLRELVEKDAITPKKAFSLIECVEQGQIPISETYSLIAAVLRES